MMRTIAFPVVALWLCACTISIACADEKAKEEPSNPKPKAKTEELGVWDGFRGIKWGTRIGDLTRFTETESLGNNTKIYSRNNDPLKIGGAQLASISYTFVSKEFSGIMIVAKGKKNSEALKDAMVARYGNPERVDASIEGRLSSVFTWKYPPITGDTVIIMLTYDLVSNDSTTVMQYLPIWNAAMDYGSKKHEEEERQKKQKARGLAEKGAKEDF